MKRIIWNMLVLVFGSTLFTACVVKSNDDDEQPTVFCPKATLCIRNPSETEIIPYSWGSNQIEDTIWPGECATREVDSISMGPNGTIFYETFHTLSADRIYEWSKCEQEYQAEEGFVDLQAKCNNGIFDPESGEQNTDCGGWCVPCKPPVFSCSLPTEAIVFQTMPTQNESLYSTDYTGWLDRVDARFDFSQNIMVASFKIPKLPKNGRKFITGSNDHEVQIRYIAGGFTDYFAAPGQEVFLFNVGPDTYRLDFCDLIIKFGTADELVNASLTFQAKE